MVKACKRCKRWESHYYWNHVDPKRFYKIMSGDFSKSMSIPEKFVKHFKGELPEILDLKGPSGRLWQVGLTKNADGMFLASRWKDFIKAHCIQEEDLLVFRFDGKSCFDVLMFDGAGCEKAAAYFVGGKDSRKRGRSEDSLEILNSTPHHKVIHCHSSTSSSSHDDSLQERRQELPLSTPHQSSRRKQKTVNKDQTVGSSCGGKIVKGNNFSVHPRKKRGKPRKNVRISIGTRDNINQEHVDVLDHEKLTLADLLQTKIRLTDTEMKKAFQLAHAVRSKNPFFISVLRPSMVGGRSCLTVPKTFAQTHLPSENQTIFLQTQGQTKKWPVIYSLQKNQALLSGGLKAFVADNNLEIGDVSLFELVENGIEIVMNVNFIRAADNVDSHNHMIPP